MKLFLSIGNLANKVSSRLSESQESNKRVVTASDLGISTGRPTEVEENAANNKKIKLLSSQGYEEAIVVFDVSDTRCFSLFVIAEALKASQTYFIGVFPPKGKALRQDEDSMFILNVLQEIRRSKMIGFLTFFSVDVIQKYDDEMTLLNREKRIVQKIANSFLEMVYWDTQEFLDGQEVDKKDFDAMISYQDFDMNSKLKMPTFFLDIFDDLCYYFILSETDAKSKEFYESFMKMLESLEDNSSYKIFVDKLSDSYCFVKSFQRAPVVFEVETK